MDNRLRVLQVVTKMDRGGLETFVMNMYRNIDRSQVQFDFLCHRFGRYAYDDEIEELGGHIYRLPRCNPLNFGYLRSVNDFFAHHPYCVVHSHIDCMSALPLSAAKRHGAVVRIAHSHNSHQDKDIKYPIKEICKHFIRKEATDLFACGVDAGRWMFGTDDFTVIHNAIDVDAYAFDSTQRARVRSELCIPAGFFTVGHVGRFAPAKNHAFIIDVFLETLRLRPDAILVLVGDGELRSETERKAIELGVADSIRFLGVRSDVAKLMQAMDVFLMPSLYEGLPLVLIEAQATGLPCLISDSIPRDCDLSGSKIVRASLADSPFSWATSLVGMRPGGNDRAEGTSVVRAAGFDAKIEAERLVGFYLRRMKES